MCGEKGGGRYHVNMNQGSPPRVRGKGVNLLVFPFKNGITPACAGKSRDKANLTAAPWDHPRVCGEKHMIENSSEIPLGSPPRVRGKVFDPCPIDCTSRITPACAGKRSLPSEKRNPVGDHPRVCGEKLYVIPVNVLHLGSPPRVRGKVEKAVIPMKFSGITPACAGKRHSHLLDRPQYRDHPRVCGEKSPSLELNAPGTGSPPRVRGKAITWEVWPLYSRITPACAGKSFLLSARAVAIRDHPRVCGEKSQKGL